MTRREKILLVIAAAAIVVAVAVAVRLALRRSPATMVPVTLTGDVLKQAADPAQQTPLSDVIVTAATAGSALATTRSGPSGFFRVTVNIGRKTGAIVLLTFNRPDYKTLELMATKPGDQLYIARMQPLQPEATPQQPQAPAQVSEIKNVRVRYSLNVKTNIDVGSLAKQFLANNVGNVPCRGHQPCSPDGRWAARRSTLALDAETGNEFRNVRVICVAGPCAFTKVESSGSPTAAQRITVSVLNWSDSADFLVEADVTRVTETELVEHSYPFIVGQTMNFALPPGSEGASIEADLSGQYTVFPLGPAAILSWASCSMEAAQNGNRIYRCQLKAGYRFGG